MFCFIISQHEPMVILQGENLHPRNPLQIPDFDRMGYVKRRRTACYPIVRSGKASRDCGSHM